MDDDSQNDSVNSIIEQLKQVPKVVSVAQEQTDELTKENLEQFILKHTGNLVKQATESVALVKDYVETAPNAEDVTALAELIRATSTAVEILNKTLISDKRNQTVVHVKELEIKSRQEQFDTAVGVKLMLTREELMKQLMTPQSKESQVKVIDVDAEKHS
jgi:hypothetical protein